MIIITLFELNHNPGTGIFTVISNDEAPCPLCCGDLAYRDRVRRNRKDLFGETYLFSLRRLKCRRCSRHHRELPNIIQPFKHYDSETIQCVIDGSPDADMCAADDSTIRRWKTTFAESEPDISMRIASIQARTYGEKIPAADAESFLGMIKGKEKQWLAFVMALLINGGHALRTRFAFCPPDIRGIVSIKLKTKTEGGQKIDKTFDDSS